MFLKYVQILLPNALNEDFTYLAEFEIVVGDIAYVEFGRQKLWGLIVEVNNSYNLNLDINKIKKVIKINEKIRLSSQHIKFINDIANYNLTNRGLVLKSFIGMLNSDKVAKDFLPFEQKILCDNINLKKLLPYQQKIYDEIANDLNSNQTFVLDGVTGSGKTEIYFALIAKILIEKPQKQILILLPEIALTSQLMHRFYQQFGFYPALWHSKISKKDKREIYYGINIGVTKVIIGARSALLLPYCDLGLIVIDEEHDQSYRQEDIFNFHARDMAIIFSKINNFPVILSSATPSLETYNNSLIGKYKYFNFTEKFGSKNIIEFIDLKNQKLPKDQILSQKLIDELGKNIENKKQSLLFLNRRGYAPITLCKACGKKYDCPNCDFHLVLHKKKNLLICHHCGFQENLKNNCKFCKTDDSLISIGVGVEKLQDEVLKLFPTANIAMITSDNIKSFNDIEKIVSNISRGTIDIIIGTQMISKGYDFANLNLVGIVDADSMLFSADMKSLERAYQNLTQVIGRVGRRDEIGKILIQSYNPENFLFKKIIDDDKKSFYDFELNNRQNMHLPPYSQMIKIEVSAIKENESKDLALNILKLLSNNDKIEIYGPAPAPIHRLKNRYHFLLHIKLDKKINAQKLVNDIKNKISISSKFRVKINFL